jgi:hypothetical protein
MIEEDQRVPLLDIGTLKKIREGSIKIRKGIAYFTPDGVRFADSMTENFDSMILATGFRPDLRKLLPDVAGVFDNDGKFLTKWRATGQPGLYFVGLSFPRPGSCVRLELTRRKLQRWLKPVWSRRCRSWGMGSASLTHPTFSAVRRSGVLRVLPARPRVRRRH